MASVTPGGPGVIPEHAGKCGMLAAVTAKQFDCPGCSAQLEFDPARGNQKCPHCGSEVAVGHSEQARRQALREQDFGAYFEAETRAAEADEAEQLTVTCQACSAETTLDPAVTASECPFCGTQLVAQSQSKRRLQPKALLPFAVANEDALNRWRRWLAGRWFAPNALGSEAKKSGRLAGVYLPYWTFDCETETDYDGERGERIEKKRSDGSRYTEMKWRRVSGTVWNRFNDLLVLASPSVPQRYAQKLEPWDLHHLVPYDDQYLSGFRAESYQLDLVAGFGVAADMMRPAIGNTVHRDIGGDSQRIHRLDTAYHEVTFKHLLLPIWISAYRFRGKVYRFLVNGRTGEVQGERPWSWIKISLTVLTTLAALTLFALLGRDAGWF